LQHLFPATDALFAQALRHDRHVYEFQQVMRIRPQAAPSSDVEDTRVVANLGVVNRRIRLVAIDMKGTASGKIECGKGCCSDRHGSGR